MFSIIVMLIGGLGLFIYGMNLMSKAIERVAGSRLRNILKAFTKNRFFGLLAGTAFTAIIQSSSAATVMVVSFVNSGLMTLAEACLTSRLTAQRLTLKRQIQRLQAQIR